MPEGAPSATKLVRMGMASRDACEDVVILRKFHRLRQDVDESFPSETRAL